MHFHNGLLILVFLCDMTGVGTKLHYFCFQNARKISKSNGCEGVMFYEKHFFEKTCPAYSKNKLDRSHFEELAFSTN